MILSQLLLAGLSLLAPVAAVPSSSSTAAQDVPIPPGEAQEIGPRKAHYMLTAGKLLGYLRYFHPSDQVAEADWLAFTMEALRRAEAAEGPVELARELDELVTKIAPTVRIFPTKRKLRRPHSALRDPGDGSVQVVAWRHAGLGLTNDAPPLASRRERADLIDGKLPAGFADPQEPFITEVGSGVTIAMPLALYADSEGTLPHVASDVHDEYALPVGYPNSSADRMTRLATVSIVGNTLTHFYPYFDEITTRWVPATSIAIYAASRGKTEHEFARTMGRLIGTVRDGLADLVPHEPRSYGELPIEFGWFDGKIIVTAAAPEVPVSVGSTVVGIGRLAVGEVLSEARIYTGAASSRATTQRALDNLRRGTLGESLTIKYSTADDPYGTRYASLEYVEPQSKTREAVQTLSSGVLYVDLDQVSDASIAGIIEQAGQASRLIFDARGSLEGLDVARFVGHLLDEPLEANPRLLPIITRPYLEGVEYEKLTTTAQPASPRLTGRCAFLVDRKTIQNAEVLLSFVQAGKLGEIIGTRPGGVRGSVAVLDIGSGYDLHFTGTKSIQLDGTRYHGLGVKLDVEVAVTPTGLAEGDPWIKHALDALDAL